MHISYLEGEDLESLSHTALNSLLDTAIEGFAHYLTIDEGRAQGTVKQYSADLRMFRRWLNAHSPGYRPPGNSSPLSTSGDFWERRSSSPTAITA